MLACGGDQCALRSQRLVAQPGQVICWGLAAVLDVAEVGPAVVRRSGEVGQGPTSVIPILLQPPPKAHPPSVTYAAVSLHPEWKGYAGILDDGRWTRSSSWHEHRDILQHHGRCGSGVAGARRLSDRTM